jgi:hypothetical protein
VPRAVSVVESQSLTVLLPEADASILPSGEKATLWTQFECSLSEQRAAPVDRYIGSSRAHHLPEASGVDFAAAEVNAW